MHSEAAGEGRLERLKVVVTGGSGFIGTNVVEQHLAEGDDVYNLDIAHPRCAKHEAVWRSVDIRHARALAEAFTRIRPDVVYHLAARTDLQGKAIGDYAANTRGVANVIEAIAASATVRRVLFASSMLVCRLGYTARNEIDYCPNTVYGESKVAGEEMVRSCRMARSSWVIVRPTSIWGPWFDVPYKNFFTAVRKGYYLHPRGFRLRRSYGFVGNAVHELKQLLLAPSRLVAGRTFYIADYEDTDVLEWAKLIRRATGKCGGIPEVPLRVLEFGAHLGDLLSGLGLGDVPLSTSRLKNLVTNAVFDMNSLRDVCGPLPYDLEDGVKITVDWLRSVEQT